MFFALIVVQADLSRFARKALMMRDFLPENNPEINIVGRKLSLNVENYSVVGDFGSQYPAAGLSMVQLSVSKGSSRR